MKIKTKLTVALTLLFALIVMLAALAVRQVNLLAEDAGNILTANYQSLDYSRTMYKLLDNISREPKTPEKFQESLDLQKSNITEVGEKELTTDLQEDFDALLKDSANTTLVAKVRMDINSIMKLNMDAIKRKSNIAGDTAKNSILWISITSSFCLIIGFTLIINLPGYIANPIRDLTESIRQIAAKNYAQRLHFKGHDEFSALAKSFNTMAQKLQEYSDTDLARVMTEKRRVETLINNLHDPVIGLDEKNRILFINEEALKISGLKKETTIGKPAADVALHNDLLRLLLQQISTAPTKEEPLKIYADNKESYFEKRLVPISIIPTGESEAKAIGSFIILQNITPYKELDVAKTSFIATVSHEFKTPIASMKMSLQLLENERTGTLNDEQKNLISSIKDDITRLLRTTGELLNITQVETGKAQLHPEPCNVNGIIHDAVAATYKIAEAKNIAVEIKIEENLLPVTVDKEKATWIVSNLVSNAIRYSYEQSKVVVSAFRHEGNIIIAVQDTGIGIEAGYQQRIFDKYFRVPGNEKEGTGLGLAISKEFITSMNGTIWVDSAIGRGSTFSISLPVSV
ncbi:histidine kinase [Flavobacterium akiainvivens]|uniref:histidine kinase n=1 Tax=Flavobacterium akiainvivens TaxID=1202724 RepID=A0A0M8MAY8_9FLAO|nr:ATP-binding protein [Flavobacterium akiainvivens]KOS07313.1 histidine kinase [Flavobacterium akiainvivens]SFQ46559.1 PAS/PAC sensor signal transduction histidine kinase [Flavobacterium akiainvivens]